MSTTAGTAIRFPVAAPSPAPLGSTGSVHCPTRRSLDAPPTAQRSSAIVRMPSPNSPPSCSSPPPASWSRRSTLPARCNAGVRQRPSRTTASCTRGNTRTCPGRSGPRPRRTRHAGRLAPRPAEAPICPSGTRLGLGRARRRFFWRTGNGGRASPAQAERLPEKLPDLLRLATHAGQSFDALGGLRHRMRRSFGKTGFQRLRVRCEAALGTLPILAQHAVEALFPIGFPVAPTRDARHARQLAGLLQRQSATDQPQQPTTLLDSRMRMLIAQFRQARNVCLLHGKRNRSGHPWLPPDLATYSNACLRWQPLFRFPKACPGRFVSVTKGSGMKPEIEDMIQALQGEKVSFYQAKVVIDSIEEISAEEKREALRRFIPVDKVPPPAPAANISAPRPRQYPPHTADFCEIQTVFGVFWVFFFLLWFLRI